MLVLAFSPLDRDPRVLRHVRELCKAYEVTTVGFGKLPIPVNRAIDLNSLQGGRRRLRETRLLVSGRFEEFLLARFNGAETKEVLGSRSFDLILANDIETLPFALEIAGSSPIWLDLHEYAYDDDASKNPRALIWRHLKKTLANDLIKEVDCLSTVGPGLASLYESRLGGVKVIWIPNAAPYRPLRPRNPTAGTVHLVYHGICTPERGVRSLIASMRDLPNKFRLTLILVGTEKEIRSLRQSSQDERIFFRPPVLAERVPELINQFDVFVYALRASSVNARHALPNKFFENVQARVGQVITPTGDMVAYLSQYNLGQCATGFSPEEIAAVLESMTHDQIAAYKNAADKAAKSLAWERFAPIIRETASRIVA